MHATEERHDTTKTSGTPARSKAQMLMADTTDDAHQVTSVADNAKNDQTHPVALGGVLILEYKINATKKLKKTYNVPEPKTATSTRHRKTVHVIPKIIRNTTGGAAPMTEANVTAYLQVAKERYAQVGVVVTWDAPVTINPPTDVTPDNGIEIVGTPDTTLDDETKALISGAGTTGTTADIHMFFVKTITWDGSGLHGVAIADYHFLGVDEDPYTYNVIVGQSTFTEDYRVVPGHELGHLLLNTGYRDAIDLHNLMYDGSSNPDNKGSDVRGERRLNTTQQGTIRGDSHVKDPT